MSWTFPGLLLCWALAAGPQPAYTIETDAPKRIEAELTFSQQYPRLKAKEWVIFAAQAPELPSQTRVSTTMDPAAKVIEELSGFGRPLLMARVAVPDKKPPQGVDVKVTYQAALVPRRLVRLAPGQKGKPAAFLSADEQKMSLAPTPTIDFQSDAFQRWLDTQGFRRVKGEDEVDFARRVFLAIRKSTPYKYQPNQDRHVSQLIGAAGGTDCGGMALMFAAVMRAGNVPARTLWGRWAESAKPNERLGDTPYYQWHVKAEFYAQGVGWVPVDLSSAVVHDKSREGLQFFGNDPGNFLTMHIDPDLVVDTVYFGKKPVGWMQGVTFWVTGAGNLEQGTSQQNWQVRK